MWAPVVTVVVALLALFATLAILVGGALGRMETRLRADVAAVRTDVAAIATDMAALRTDVHALSDRVARIEGALTGPWRPANGSPAPTASTAPEATE